MSALSANPLNAPRHFYSRGVIRDQATGYPRFGGMFVSMPFFGVAADSEQTSTPGAGSLEALLQIALEEHPLVDAGRTEIRSAEQGIKSARWNLPQELVLLEVNLVNSPFPHSQASNVRMLR